MMIFTKVPGLFFGHKGWQVLFVLMLLAFRPLPARSQASLRVDGKQDGMTAELLGSTQQGGFRPDYAASSEWAFGAWAEGRKKVGKAVFEGSFSFDLSYGKAMSGSMFISPGLFPVDVLEFTPGDKTLRRYHFTGGLGVEIAPQWLLGARFAFLSADYSKRKDIRHTNFGLDLEVEPNVAWQSPDGWFLQLGGVYRRRYEQIKAERIGSETAVNYYAFLDKGLSYGAWQLWDGDGIHLAETGVGVFPVSENAWGLTLELRKEGWTARLKGLRTRGSIGEKGYDWFRFPGWEATAELAWEQASDRISLRADADAEHLEESVLEKVAYGGVVTPVIYGWNGISHRFRSTVLLGWTHRWQTEPDAPRWTSDLSWEGAWSREKSHYVYPYTDAADIVRMGLQAGVKARFAAVELRAGLSGAGGWSREQGLQAQADVQVEPPFRLQEHWNRVLEYARAPRVGAAFGVHWYIPALKGLYLRADLSCLRAFQIVYLPSPWRYAASLGVGYGF